MKKLFFPITNYNRTYTKHTNAMSVSPVVISDRCTYTDECHELFTAELILFKEEEEKAKSGSKTNKDQPLQCSLSKVHRHRWVCHLFKRLCCTKRRCIAKDGPSIESNPGKRCQSIVESHFQTLSAMMSKIPQKRRLSSLGCLC